MIISLRIKTIASQSHNAQSSATVNFNDLFKEFEFHKNYLQVHLPRLFFKNNEVEFY